MELNEDIDDNESRIIYLFGEVDESMAYKFISSLNKLAESPEDIRIIISSIGGDEDSGYAIYDAMRNVKNNLIIEGYGLVGSIAAIIFQGADVRHLAPNCDYLIHNGSVYNNGSVEQDSLIKLAGQIQKNKKKYYQILFDSSNLEWQQIEDFCKEEKYFTAKEALEAGLTDFIIKPIKKISKKKRKNK